MVVCLVSSHTRDDTGKRWPQNGTVGPEIAMFTKILGIGSKVLPTNSSANITYAALVAYAWSAIDFFLTSWFSGKTNSFVVVIFLGRSEDGTEPS